MSAKILYYKQPSFKHKVYYQKYVDELFDEHISENMLEDEKIDKNIANINMGMLEKGSIKTACNMHNNVKNIPTSDKKMLLLLLSSLISLLFAQFTRISVANGNFLYIRQRS